MATPKETLKKTFGQEIRRLRQEARKPLREVAGFFEWSIPYLSDMEHDRRYPPDPPTIRRLADFFKRPELADKLVELSVKSRKDEITLKAVDARTRRLLVTLERRLESQELDPQTMAEIERLLDSLRKEEDGTCDRQSPE